MAKEFRRGIGLLGMLPGVWLLISLFGASVLGRTAERHFEVLRTLDGRAFTNAVVSSSTPSYLIVLYDGGGQKIYLTNLDEKVQALYGFDASAAEAFQRKEADKKKKAQDAAARDAQVALEAENAVGEVQRVQVLAFMGEYKYRIKSEEGEAEVVFLTMPATLTQFLDQENAAEAQRAAAAAGASTAAPAVRKGRGKRAALNANYAAAGAEPQAGQAAANASKAKPSAADSTWHELEAGRAEKTTILAGPTGKVLYGFRVWQFTGFPPKTTVSAPKAKQP